MDLDRALGAQLKAIPVAWNQRDILLYAIGVRTPIGSPFKYFIHALLSDWRQAGRLLLPG